MRSPIRLLALLALATPVPAEIRIPDPATALVPAGTGGIGAVDRGLARLQSHRRLLIVGAHPDDEDTTLLAYVSVELGGEAAYLSLSRGEGGQNLIGPELGVGLGLVRTGELLAARRLEGTRQYFTRAFDFGYTRSLDETLRRWPREVLDEDAVRIVRRFKPQVIVAIFGPDSGFGHGQHQAAGVIAESIFAIAGEPDRFPDLTAVGLGPWQPTALYRRLWREGDDPSVEFPLDGIDPLTGKSVLQIAAGSRSMHRSQDMGTLQPLGRRQGGLLRLDGEADAAPADLFAGVDTSLGAIADLLSSSPLRRRVREDLDGIAQLAKKARDGLAPVRLAAAIPTLVTISRRLDMLESTVTAAQDQPGSPAVAALLAEKKQVAASALMAASGLVVDAVADRDEVTPGGSLGVTVSFWDSERRGAEARRVELWLPEDWQADRVEEGAEDGRSDGLESWRFEVRLPPTAVTSVPYYLDRPLKGDLYSWEDVEPEALGTPLLPGPIVASLDIEVAGVSITIEREVVFRDRDQVLGEVRRPVRVVPELEVTARPSLLLWPNRDRGPKQVEIVIRSNLSGPVAGSLELAGSGIWPAVEALEFAIPKPKGRCSLRIELEPPPAAGTERVELLATAVLGEDRIFATAFPVVAYPHIRPQTLPVPARIELQSFDLELPRLDSVGYVRGASDRVPEVLKELGLPVRLLSPQDLETADLSVFDVIVIGSRAYETDATLAELNSRLLDYVRSGGQMVVQYQQYQFVQGGYSPVELEIGRPHGRVTDETAAVEMLEDPVGVFSFPNAIGSTDWLGWVQERGLYFASDWEKPFIPLLEMSDPGLPPERGALLVAQVGKGRYIYTGLSFFRQLPAGVPGAIRLFVNLLATGRS